jgi:thioredoxin-related protein
MKKILFSSIALVTMLLLVSAFTFSKKTPPVAEKVQWLTWQEAFELNKKAPKKILVDVYTSWCGWCKVMDKETFTDKKVAEYLSKNFYCVKLDAEMTEPIEFSGQKFEYVQQGTGKGIHTLAYSLLDGNLGYPSIVYLTEKYERVVISPGFKKPEQLITELKYTAEEVFKTKNFKDYSEGK